MTIISVAAFGKGKNGVLHWSRQFMPIQKSRIDAILYAFPKLHYLQPYDGTFLDSDTVRYVYYFAFDIMFVMVTSKLSNLSQDQQLLQLIARIVHTTCYPTYGGLPSQEDLNNEVFKRNIFEIFCSLDEIIEYGGFPSEIGATIDSIQTTLLMDSHEEHRYNLQQAGKLKDAKLKSSQRAAEIDRNRKLGIQGTGDPELDARIVGIGSGSAGGGGYQREDPYKSSGAVDHSPSSPTSAPSTTRPEQKDPTAVSSLGFDGSKLSFAKEEPKTVVAKKTIGPGGKVIAGGRKLGATKGKMVLGKKTLVEEPEREEVVSAVSGESLQHQQNQNQHQNQHQNQPQNQHNQQNQSSPQSVPSTQPQRQELGEIDQPYVKIEEQIQIQMDIENSIQAMSLQGKLSLLLPTTSTPNYAVQLNPIQTTTFGNALKLQTRPGLDKEQWSQNTILYNSDPNKVFNTGPTKPNILFQWTMRLNESTASGLSSDALKQLVPFNLTLWASSNSPGTTTVSIDLDQNPSYSSSPHTAALENITVAIPCPVQPVLLQVDKPWKYNEAHKMLLWSLGSLSTASHKVTSTPDMGPKCAIEFEVQGDFEQEVFLPIQLKLVPSQSLAGILPARVFDTATSQPVEFKQLKEVQVNSFQFMQGQ